MYLYNAFLFNEGFEYMVCWIFKQQPLNLNFFVTYVESGMEHP